MQGVLNDGYMLDPSMQKQMAALVNTQSIRNNRTSTGTISGFGGNESGHPSAPFLDSPMSARPGNPPNFKQRQTGFLNYVAHVMIKRNTPLPPSLTGVPAPAYDPNTSPFKVIEPSQSVGAFRLAGKDVDLFKLWGLVVQNGGSQQITANKAWHSLLPHFDLPEISPEPLPNGSTSVALALQYYYSGILFPFEEMYNKNLQEKMKNTISANQSSPPSQRPLAGSPFPPQPQTPQQRPPSSATPLPSSDSPAQPTNHSSDMIASDSDAQALKRKLEQDDAEGKRARQKTDPESENDRSSAGPSGRRQMPSRRKIEYVPFAREIDTYGGRDLRQLESELAALPQRRPLRDVNEWGVVDIEALTLSIRSRLSTELSYSLTTLSLLSTMKGQTPGSGFPIFQCQDLLDELLDLLEDTAFSGIEDTFDVNKSMAEPLVTHRDLLTALHESELDIFANLRMRQGCKDPDLGPRQRPGNLVLVAVNIIRNLSVVHDNVEFIAKQMRLIDLLLRLCDVEHRSLLRPVSPVLSLSDLITIRKDALYTLSAIGGLLHISDEAKDSIRIAARTCRLVASYLVDSFEAVSPLQCVQVAGALHGAHLRPPTMADIALEVFARFGQPDGNRQAFSRFIPDHLISSLFVSLVHRLPMVDADFQLVMREQWLSYLEKTIMALYTLAFLAPPHLKSKLKTDRKLGFKGVMLRMVQRFLITQESRASFMVCARRAIETMKILDDCENLFDQPTSTGPTIAFGMGYGELGENSAEKGTGLLGGHRELTWDMLMLREVWADEVIFGELESLARVDI